MSEWRERIILIDDDPDMHYLVEELIVSIGLEIDHYHRPLEFIDQFEHQGPGVIVSDLIMPEMTGIELLHQVKAKHIVLPFVVFSGYADAEGVISAFRSGAFNFIEKPFSRNTFLTVVQQAIEYSRFQLSSDEEQQELERRVDDLTRREAQVVQTMLSGASNKKIARTLGISHRTVEHHRQCALKKLGVQSAVELSALLLHTRLNQVPQHGDSSFEGIDRVIDESDRIGCSPRWLDRFGNHAGSVPQMPL